MKPLLRNSFFVFLIGILPGGFQAFAGNSPEEKKAKACEEANVSIAKAVLAAPGNEKILEKMVQLAELKWAYRIAKAAKGDAATLEGYVKLAPALEVKDTENLKKKVKESYEKYGINSDIEFLNEINAKRSNRDYFQKGRRLDNQTAGALSLYLSQNDGDDQTIPEEVKFKESDAAAIWALRTILEKKKGEGASSVSQNLLDFSVRLCKTYGSRACGSSRPVISTEDAGTRAKQLASEIEAAIKEKAEALKAAHSGCFTENCESGEPITAEQVAGIRDALLGMVSRTLNNGEPEIQIDFAKTKFENGSLALHFVDSSGSARAQKNPPAPAVPRDRTVSVDPAKGEVCEEYANPEMNEIQKSRNPQWHDLFRFAGETEKQYWKSKTPENAKKAFDDLMERAEKYQKASIEGRMNKAEALGAMAETAVKALNIALDQDSLLQDQYGYTRSRLQNIFGYIAAKTPKEKLYDGYAGVFGIKNEAVDRVFKDPVLSTSYLELRAVMKKGEATLNDVQFVFDRLRGHLRENKVLDHPKCVKKRYLTTWEQGV